MKYPVVLRVARSPEESGEVRSALEALRYHAVRCAALAFADAALRKLNCEAEDNLEILAGMLCRMEEYNPAKSRLTPFFGIHTDPSPQHLLESIREAGKSFFPLGRLYPTDVGLGLGCWGEGIRTRSFAVEDAWLIANGFRRAAICLAEEGVAASTRGGCTKALLHPDGPGWKRFQLRIQK